MQGSKLAPKLDEYVQCIRQPSYSNAKFARRALKRMRAKAKDDHPIARYLCPHCGAWHVGHVPMTPETVDVDGSFRA